MKSTDKDALYIGSAGEFHVMAEFLARALLGSVDLSAYLNDWQAWPSILTTTAVAGATP